MLSLYTSEVEVAVKLTSGLKNESTLIGGNQECSGSCSGSGQPCGIVPAAAVGANSGAESFVPPVRWFRDVCTDTQLVLTCAQRQQGTQDLRKEDARQDEIGRRVRHVDVRLRRGRRLRRCSHEFLSEGVSTRSRLCCLCCLCTKLARH